MEYKYDPKHITYFAATDSRAGKQPFGIRAEDRTRHMYIIGKTGMGKSTMLENMAIQDIQNGDGMAFIDPHGSTTDKLLEYVPEDRIKDVIYFAPFDMEYPIGFNVMEDVGYDKRHLVVAGLMSAFKRIWVDAWSARMEYILQNTLLALLEYPDTTLIDVNRMLINKAFRDKVTNAVSDPIVKRFWAEEFAGYSDRYTQEATPAIQNKIGQFTSNPLVRNIIGQPKSTFDLRKIMDERKIMIINLSKGRMGEQNADLLGSILTTKIYLAAMSRAEETVSDLATLPPFYLYVDEFQSVVNDSFVNILSEARKYKLCLTIAHQYIEQIEENIRDAVFGNVGTTISFRVGPFDAETLKTVFEPTFYAEDMVNLGFTQIYLTLMIDSVGSQPFSAHTLPPVDDPPFSYKEKIIQYSQKSYGKPRAEVEKLLQDPSDVPNKSKSSGNDKSRQTNSNFTNKKKVQKSFTASKTHPTLKKTYNTTAEQNKSKQSQQLSKQKNDLAEALGSMKQHQSKLQSPANILRAKIQKKQTQQTVKSAKSKLVARATAPASNPTPTIQAGAGSAKQHTSTITTEQDKNKQTQIGEVSDTTLRQILRDE